MSKISFHLVPHVSLISRVFSAGDRTYIVLSPNHCESFGRDAGVVRCSRACLCRHIQPPSSVISMVGHQNKTLDRTHGLYTPKNSVDTIPFLGSSLVTSVPHPITPRVTCSHVYQDSYRLIVTTIPCLAGSANPEGVFVRCRGVRATMEVTSKSVSAYRPGCATLH